MKIGSVPTSTHGLQYTVYLQSGDNQPGGDPTAAELDLSASALNRADVMEITDPTGRLVAQTVGQAGTHLWTTRYTEDGQLGTAQTIDLDDPVWWAILHCSEALTATEAAAVMGVASGDGARRQLARWGVAAIGRGPGRGGESLYLTTEVLAAIEGRPGRGARTDRKATNTACTPQ